MAIETLSISPWFMVKLQLEDLDWILNFRNLKKLTITNFSLDFEDSYMFNVLKKIDGMQMIEFADCMLKDGFLEQFPPGLKLIIQRDCTFYFHISYLLEVLNSLGEMKAKKMLEINNIDIDFDHDLDKEETEEIFEKAQEIINEKFDGLTYNIRENQHYFRLKTISGRLSSTFSSDSSASSDSES